MLVSIAVLILRYREPERPRGFRAPLGPLFPVLSIIFCIVLMMGLEVMTWVAFFAWLVDGTADLLLLQPPPVGVCAATLRGPKWEAELADELWPYRLCCSNIHTQPTTRRA